MFKRKGQNIAEYSIVIAIVIAAAVAMQIYVKRGLQGRMADAVDHAPSLNVEGEALTFSTKQYEPYYMSSESTISSSRNAQESIGAGGATTRTGITEESKRGAGSFEETTYNEERHR